MPVNPVLRNHAFPIATTLYVLEVTGSATMVAAVMMAATVPLVLLAPVGGTVADRHVKQPRISRMAAAVKATRL
jgi:hypothetical protein